MASGKTSSVSNREEEVFSPVVKKKRTLPPWMSGAKKQPPVNGVQDKIESTQKNPKYIGLNLPLLEFKGKIHYSYLKDDCSLTCGEILDNLKEGITLPVGLDLEWPVTYQQGKEPKTALLQLCTSSSECHLFHLACMAGFPLGLKRLLGDPRVIKAGIGIVGDLWKLERDFDIKALPLIEGSAVDLGPLARQILKTTEQWSLDGLSQQLLSHCLNKDPVVRKSDWSNYPLSDHQQIYAATDAYASLLIYEELMNRQKKTATKP